VGKPSIGANLFFSRRLLKATVDRLSCGVSVRNTDKPLRYQTSCVHSPTILFHLSNGYLYGNIEIASIGANLFLSRRLPHAATDNVAYGVTARNTDAMIWCQTSYVHSPAILLHLGNGYLHQIAGEQTLSGHMFLSRRLLHAATDNVAYGVTVRNTDATQRRQTAQVHTPTIHLHSGDGYLYQTSG